MWFPMELYQGQPDTTETVMYTVPANRQLVIKEFVICNTSAVDLTITIHIRRAAAVAAVDRRIMSALVIPANATVYFPCSIVLNTTGIISGLASVANLTVTVSGEERII